MLLVIRSKLKRRLSFDALMTIPRKEGNLRQPIPAPIGGVSAAVGALIQVRFSCPI
jgi:hypothetical protein